MIPFYRSGNRGPEKLKACLRSHSLNATELTFEPREQPTKNRLGREVSGDLRGRREM